jgi:hypothetical protein
MSITSHSFAEALFRLLVAHARWQGTANSLLETLSQSADSSARSRGWPPDEIRISRLLSHMAPALAHADIHLSRSRRGKRRTRIITLEWVAHSSVAGHSAEACLSALREAYDIAEGYYALARRYGGGHRVDVLYTQECLDLGVTEEEIIERLTRFSPVTEQEQIVHRCTLVAAKFQRAILGQKSYQIISQN